MEKPGFSELIDGLIYEDTIPLRWMILTAHPNNLEMAKYHYQNHQVLQILLSMDTAIPDLEDEPEAVTHELERLDSKLNLLLAMVGRILGNTLTIPEPVTVSLGGNALTFAISPDEVKSLPDGSQWLAKIELFLDLQFPMPVTLITDLSFAKDDTSATILLARYQDHDDKLLDLMEKYIFRQHRRQIAQTRHRD